MHGQNNVSVTAVDGAACPGGGTGCYQVTITSDVPLFLSPVVGYTGNATVSTVTNGATTSERQTRLASTALATRSGTSRDYCIMALGDRGTEWDVLVNGGSKSRMHNCGIMSNDRMLCNGSGKVADFADSPYGDGSPCGQEAHSRPAQKLPNPYAKLVDDIPDHTCTGYAGTTLGSGSVALTTLSLPSQQSSCGTLKLAGNVKITSPTTLFIHNGNLDLNGFKLEGSALTVVFTGTSGAYSHIPVDTKPGGKGVLDITPPKSGPWSGVALYQDPRLTTGLDITSAGSSPTWNITGLVHLPNAKVTVNGAIGKSSSGNECFAMVVDSLTVSGTGLIMANGDDCPAAGLGIPSLLRGKLVG